MSQMKLKKHPNGKWYAHLTDGQRINLDTENEREAKRLAKAAKLEEIEFAAKARLLTAEAITRLSAGTKISNAEALEEWRNWAETVGLAPTTVYTQYTRLAAFFRDWKLLRKMPNEITDVICDSFINPKDDKSGSATRNSRLSALRSYYELCVAKGWALRDPTAALNVKMHLLSHEQKETRVREPFTKAELAKLAKLDDPFWRAAVLLGYETGLRINDVVTLEVASLKDYGRVVIWTDKHDKRVSLPVSKQLYEMLRDLCEPGEQYVFPEQAKIAKDVTRRNRFPTYFKRILDRCEIPEKSFHCLRHTFATERGREGETIDQIRERLGHSSSETTKIYVHA